jgi:hypothetical protein
MWQRERLVNIAIASLPATCDKVAWVDADLLFGNDDWVAETSELLGEYVLVQPFQAVRFLRRDDVSPSFTRERGPGVEDLYGAAYARHIRHADAGHPGMAWAGRRDVLETHGLYDRAPLGGPDVVHRWAMSGQLESQAGWDKLAEWCSAHQLEDVLRWARPFYAAVKERVSYTRGLVCHLWHGDMADRQYASRQLILKTAKFNPAADLSLNRDSCWQWNSDKPELHRAVKEYFWNRKEES